MRRIGRMGLSIPAAVVNPSEAGAVFKNALPIADLGVTITTQAGEPDATSAPAAIASLRRAVTDVSPAPPQPWSPIRLRKASFTGPVSPSRGNRILGDAWRRNCAGSQRPVMMLWSPELAVVPVTIHLPLREIFAQLSAELMVETGRIVARDLAATVPHPTAAARRSRAQSPRGRRRYARRRGPHDRCSPPVERLKATASMRADRCPPTPFSTPRPRELRCRAVHVSRSGADPDQDACLRPRGQCHAWPAFRAYLARSRHRLRHRRHRHRRPDEPGCGPSAGGEACQADTERRLPRRERRRRPAAAARGHPPARSHRRRSRSGRISCSISISPPASRGQQESSPAPTCSRSAPDRVA